MARHAVAVQTSNRGSCVTSTTVVPPAAIISMTGGAPSNFYHVAIYLGNGQVVHALNPQEGIGVTSLSAMSGMQLYGYAARY